MNFINEINLNKLNEYSLLTKEQIRNHIDQMITKNNENLITSDTGNSTGKV